MTTLRRSFHQDLTPYRLPGGRVVQLSDATRGERFTTYQLGDGTVVTAERVDVEAEAALVTWLTLDTLAFTSVVRECRLCPRTCYYDTGSLRWRHVGVGPSSHPPTLY